MASHLNLNLPEYEKMITCPYNKSHQVIRHRMPYHLVKCRRSHTSVGTKECRFNSSHVVLAEEIVLHEFLCPDRMIVEQFMTDQHPRRTEKKKLESSESIADSMSRMAIVNEDNWDDMLPATSYDPKKRCLEDDIMVHVQHGTPLQRKGLRAIENTRLNVIRGVIDPRDVTSKATKRYQP